MAVLAEDISSGFVGMTGYPPNGDVEFGRADFQRGRRRILVWIESSVVAETKDRITVIDKRYVSILCVPMDHLGLFCFFLNIILKTYSDFQLVLLFFVEKSLGALIYVIGLLTW